MINLDYYFCIDSIRESVYNEDYVYIEDILSDITDGILSDIIEGCEVF